MPSVAQESPTVHSSKKRRRDDNTHQIPLSHSPNHTPRGIFSDKAFDHNTGLFHHHHSSPLLPRKIIPLPPGKRQRTAVDIDVETEDEPMQRSPSSSPSHRHDHFHHERHQHRRHHSKRAPQQQHDLDERTRSPAPLMSRCHICFRKPNKKSDLDSFADCQGCGQRTCYVCIRECLGWAPSAHYPSAAATTTIETTKTTTTASPEEEGETSFTMLDADADAAEDQQQPHQPSQLTEPKMGEHGHGQGWTRGGGHRQVVCSRCCVERGQDGEVVCLGCLPFVEG